MAFLRRITPGEEGITFEIEQDLTSIGRGPGNLIFLDDASVSGRHCSLRRNGREFTLLDQNSTNGTTVNGELIDKARLKAKDIVCVGSVELLFDGDDIEPPPPTPEAPPEGSVSEPGVPLHPLPEVVFRPKKNRRGLWTIIITTVGLMALVAGLWFLLRLVA